MLLSAFRVDDGGVRNGGWSEAETAMSEGALIQIADRRTNSWVAQFEDRTARVICLALLLLLVVASAASYFLSEQV